MDKKQEVEIYVGGKYKLIKKIGEGAFGEIFIARNVSTAQDVAVKLVIDPYIIHVIIRKVKKKAEICLYTKPKSTIDSPANVHSLALSNSLAGFPTFYYYGVEGKFNVMVMELLGPNIDDLFTFCKYKFSLRTTLMLADQMVSLYILTIFYLAFKNRSPPFSISYSQRH